jgi:hypothetical protein
MNRPNYRFAKRNIRILLPVLASSRRKMSDEFALFSLLSRRKDTKIEPGTLFLAVYKGM